MWQWIIGGVLVLLLVASCWYTYRWYMYGDDLPVEFPAFVMADPSVDESEVTATLVDNHTVPPLQPRYVSIPSIGVRQTRTFAMGVDKNNMLQSPANISDAAWYNKSDTPGSGGVVLINAHNGGITRNGVFAKLGALKKGDIIELQRGDGEIFKYEVRENQSMPLEEVNDTGMKMMMQPVEIGKEALNLITCDGKWVPRFKQFDHRIMLRAVLIDA
jgi:LPXTG-site transpeptidase (sortase) family protein